MLLTLHWWYVLNDSAAFRQQKQLVYGTLDSQNDLQRAIVQVSNDVKAAEAVSLRSVIPHSDKGHPHAHLTHSHETLRWSYTSSIYLKRTSHSHLASLDTLD